MEEKVIGRLKAGKDYWLTNETFDSLAKEAVITLDRSVQRDRGVLILEFPNGDVIGIKIGLLYSKDWGFVYAQVVAFNEKRFEFNAECEVISC